MEYVRLVSALWHKADSRNGLVLRSSHLTLFGILNLKKVRLVRRRTPLIVLSFQPLIVETLHDDDALIDVVNTLINVHFHPLFAVIAVDWFDLSSLLKIILTVVLTFHAHECLKVPVRGNIIYRVQPRDIQNTFIYF